jgi:hypothetical protein
MNKENKYLIELEVSFREIYRINSDIPLTKGEVLARVNAHKPDEIDTDRDSISPNILVIKGSLEEEYIRPVNVYPATEKGG